MAKTYAKSQDEIVRLIPSLGACYASDRIVVDGQKVGYMVRDDELEGGRSGWTFMAGTESQAYADDAGNWALYDVNTIANYDPEIIPYLSYPPGTEVARDRVGAPLEIVAGPDEPPPVTFLMSLPPGTAAITREWTFTISNLLLRRFEEGSLVLWRPGFTIWLTAFNASAGTAAEARLAGWRDRISAAATDLRQIAGDRYDLLRYQLVEGGQTAVYAIAVAAASDLQVSIYYDDPSQLGEIDLILSTLTYTSA